MALASYADLQDQVANWLARSDLTAYIPDMVTLFEAAAARRLKVRPQVTTSSLTTVSGVASLPTDYLGHIRATWQGSPLIELTYVAPSIYQYYNGSPATGYPSYYTIEGGNFKSAPYNDDSDTELLYYAKTGALSSALQWLFTNHPDAYLFGTLAEANFFNRGEALTMAATWKARRDEVFDEIRMLDFNERAGMAVRVIGVTP